MKKDKTKTTGYSINTVILCLLGFAFVAYLCSSNKEDIQEEREAEQYNEIVENLQKQGYKVNSDGYYISVDDR